MASTPEAAARTMGSRATQSARTINLDATQPARTVSEPVAPASLFPETLPGAPTVSPTATLLHQTRALCPECLSVLPAPIVADAQGRVWMTRSCPHHGTTETLIWPDAGHYQWLRSLAFANVAPKSDTVRPSNLPCPTGCGICHRHKRKPTLVEIELTQRCNLRCPVCFMSAESAASDVPLERLDDFIEAIARTAGVDTGVQLTGGEPTLRADLPEIVARLRARGFWGVELNTNGVVIARDPEFLRELVKQGLTGVYLQFDGLSGGVYEKIRGQDLLATKLAAVESCRAAGVQVVLAMTVVSGINDGEVGAVLDYAARNADTVCGLALQPAFTSGRFDAERTVPLNMGDVIMMLEAQSNGLIQASDIWPLGCSHPLCDTGTFLAWQDGRLKPVTRDLTRQEYLQLYNPNSPQGSVFLDVMVRKGLNPAGGISLVIMNYMDAYNADLERLAECSMFVTMPDGALVPFCSYQLTDCRGQRLFSPWCIPGAENGINWDEYQHNDG